MSIEFIQALSMNPHFMARLIQAFLSSYGEECNMQKAFLAIPLLYHEPAREKLLTAKTNSRLESIYSGKSPLDSGDMISSRSRIAGFEERYTILIPYIKQAIIVGCNEQIITFSDSLQLKCVKALNYKDKSLTKSVVPWIRAANYLGVLFKKATPEQLTHILEVDFT